eukprot:CAMPEP_0170415774 /NCGR_PEP_ID=MMETSP0117_2-20130122/32790_1 /TAXON_ID=400756 /ORGANISM="Durinskia baltica, Strain CSIRO CS-38" /LENGTH=268 /DNA_ID=CAMNT_0010673771 /DNA_START=24 /DNA_END=831 /DNA_ORIENTATION=+
MVIGIKGAQVNEIQTQTGTKIDVDFETDPCKCYVKGDPEAVMKAKKVLLTIAMQIEDDGSEYIDLPKSTSGAVIGAQGQRIRDFQEQSGARIDVDKTGPRCRVRLTGTPDQIAMAKALIMQEVENNNAPHKPLSLPPPQTPMVIPAHQPTTFPATLSESIARAKAAAEAVKNGLITTGASGFPSSPPPAVPPPPPGLPPMLEGPPMLGGGGNLEAALTSNPIGRGDRSAAVRAARGAPRAVLAPPSPGVGPRLPPRETWPEEGAVYLA